MMSAKVLDFLTPSCPHLDQIYTIKFVQPPLLHLLFIPYPPPMRTSYLEAPLGRDSDSTNFASQSVAFHAPSAMFNRAKTPIAVYQWVAFKRSLLPLLRLASGPTAAYTYLN